MCLTICCSCCSLCFEIALFAGMHCCVACGCCFCGAYWLMVAIVGGVLCSFECAFVGGVCC